MTNQEWIDLVDSHVKSAMLLKASGAPIDIFRYVHVRVKHMHEEDGMFSTLETSEFSGGVVAIMDECDLELTATLPLLIPSLIGKDAHVYVHVYKDGEKVGRVLVGMLRFRRSESSALHYETEQYNSTPLGVFTL